MDTSIDLPALDRKMEIAVPLTQMCNRLHSGGPEAGSHAQTKEDSMAGTTLKDVAAAAGVSISTASRSLSGNPAISESTRQRVKDTAIKLNYRPNAQARALRSSRSNAIGLVIPSLDNAYFAAMAAAIEEAADKQGLATMITSCGEDPQRLVKSLDALMERQVDGIIAVPLEGAEEALEQARAYRPLVLIDRTLGQIPAVLSTPTRA